jgi:hypothetical protein
MNVFSRSISLIFKGAGKAVSTFPASVACAIGFTIVTIIRIAIDWQQQEPYNFLFNSLHWSFALGAVFSLVPITAARNRVGSTISILLANILGIMAALAAFLALYLPGGIVSEGSRYARLSNLSMSRVGAAILVSLITFIILAGYPKDQSDFSRSFFMTLKAFFIALLYGAVIMSGTSGVAGAVQTLLYRGMSEKVYQYIGTLVGFLAFTIFIGYFPDFRKGQVDEQREIAQKQPRFIEILFGTIMIPIVLALTAILLIWAGRIVITGSWPVFTQLSSIAASYALGGIWLHVMVTRHESGLAAFYRRFYPITALVILAFEAWALINQLNKVGMKTDSYFFGLILVMAVAAVVLLLAVKEKAHVTIALIICVLAVFSILPGLGYQALPVASQSHRLEKLLTSQGMLEGIELKPASILPVQSVREQITDSVDYLSGVENAKLPAWFDKRLVDNSQFKAKLGFDKIWPTETGNPDYNSGYVGTSLILSPVATDISNYQWAVSMQDNSGKGEPSVTIEGDKGTYLIRWTMNPPSGIPSLKIELDNRVILEKDMNEYIDRLSTAFPPSRLNPVSASLEDMSLALETPEVTVLLVFSNIDINVDPSQDVTNYWFNLSALYMAEKP